MNYNGTGIEVTLKINRNSLDSGQLAFLLEDGECGGGG